MTECRNFRKKKGKEENVLLTEGAYLRNKKNEDDSYFVRGEGKESGESIGGIDAEVS